MKSLFIIAAILGASATAAAGAATPFDGTCTAASGAQRTPLVELYTSEGCSSCPPADRLLAQLDRMLPAGVDAVPIALHVAYWDELGWKDPYAQAAFSQRHGRLVHDNGHTIVYTPHFFVDGRELRAGGDAVRDAVVAINAMPARASLRASARAIGQDIEIDVTASADPAIGAALVIAVTQDGLVSDVRRGENRGVRLAHDHVARQWIGPLPLAAGSLAVHRTVPRSGPPGTRLDLVAFVEDTGTGAVLQSVVARDCGRSGNSARP